MENMTHGTESEPQFVSLGCHHDEFGHPEQHPDNETMAIGTIPDNPKRQMDIPTDIGNIPMASKPNKSTPTPQKIESEARS
jgi:hypothetical protein